MVEETPEMRTAKAEPSDAPDPDPGKVFSAEGVDLTAIRWMLSLTPTERLQAAQDLIDTARSLKSGDEA